MKKLVYTILDEKGVTIGPLFVAASDAEAMRSVHASLPSDSIARRYPADFALLRVCQVNTSTGSVSIPVQDSGSGLVGEDYPVLVAKLDSIFAE